ncbi:MAG: sugar phosphate isomerase/epimerase [Chloroflexota bacterium]|nr:sugar phosphate isomerase/epimerase [Chloroflexota bacterium]
MNPIGVNTWVWVSPPTDDALAEIAPRLHAWGFDLIEIPLESPSDWDPARTAALLAENGLSASICLAMGPGRDLIADRATVAATQDYVRECVDRVAILGGRVVAGPLYTPVGDTRGMRRSERAAAVDRLVAGLRPLVDYAGEREVTLAIEPINRFETSFLNTAEQALEVVARVDSPALGVLLDTFHMNIEEKDQAAAIRLVGSRLAHLHACGSDRGSPGADHIAWPEIAVALTEIDYQGALVIESFTPQNQSIARAAAIWRPLAESQDALATDGLAFLKSTFAS